MDPSPYVFAGATLRPVPPSAASPAENLSASTPLLPPGVYEVEGTSREGGGGSRLLVLDPERPVEGSFFPRNDPAARAEGRYLPPPAEGRVEVDGYRFWAWATPEGVGGTRRRASG